MIWALVIVIISTGDRQTVELYGTMRECRVARQEAGQSLTTEAHYLRCIRVE